MGHISFICKRLSVWMIFCFLFISCSFDRKTEVILREFMKEEIIIPEKMLVVYDRSISDVRIDSTRANMLMYFDSTECNRCIIDKLFIFDGLFELQAVSNEFGLCLIFSPKEEEYDALVKELMIADYPYPIYVDYNGVFRKLNPQIPEDRRFHCFLLDKNGYPVFVGNPVASERMMELFKTALDRL